MPFSERRLRIALSVIVESLVSCETWAGKSITSGSRVLCVRTTSSLFANAVLSHKQRTADMIFEVALNVARQLIPTAINQLWVADITYVRLGRVDVFLAVVMDAFSRRIVGWNLAPKITTELALVALRNAIESRQPAPGLIHHSDRGVQYASAAYVDTLLQHGMIPSMSRPGNPYDNAKCERFMKTLKQEEICCFEYRDIEDLRANLSVFLDGYYNATRLHSALGYLSPNEFERRAAQSTAADIPQAPA